MCAECEKPHEFSYLSLTTRIYSRWKYFGTNSEEALKNRKFFYDQQCGVKKSSSKRNSRWFMASTVISHISYKCHSFLIPFYDESTLLQRNVMDTKICRGRRGKLRNISGLYPQWPKAQLIFLHTTLQFHIRPRQWYELIRVDGVQPPPFSLIIGLNEVKHTRYQMSLFWV